MGTWWLDETSPCPGPYEERTLQESWNEFGKALGRVGMVGGLTLERISKIFATESSKDYVLINNGIDWKGEEEEYNDRKNKEHELAETDRNLKVPPGTTVQLFKEFGELNERSRKRQIGRGNIAGKGPRSKTTFKRGHKQY